MFTNSLSETLSVVCNMLMGKENQGTISILKNLELLAKTPSQGCRRGRGVGCHQGEWQGGDILKFEWSPSSEEKNSITALAGDVYSIPGTVFSASHTLWNLVLLATS